MQATIVVKDVRKCYGDTPAVDGVSLKVEGGEFFGIPGPNGAGKTTLLEIAEGPRGPDSGAVSLLGSPVWPRDSGCPRAPCCPLWPVDCSAGTTFGGPGNGSAGEADGRRVCRVVVHLVVGDQQLRRGGE
jgi:energy-coupling factor transporter ATP-binding protein EcfA2